VVVGVLPHVTVLRCRLDR